MKKVAIFGNAGGGKSTLAKQLGKMTHLPVYHLDLIQYRIGGGAVPEEEFTEAHRNLLNRESWIIDGFGTAAAAWQRFEAADTLIYVDLPLATHRWLITKRFLKSIFVLPEGYPSGSPMWQSTMDSFKVVGLCHRHLTPKYRILVHDTAASKRVHHLRSRSEIKIFLKVVSHEVAEGAKAR